MSSIATGAWTEFNFTISDEAQKVFDQVFAQFTGVKYTAVAVATQVVAGTNYSFLSKADPVTLNPVEFAAKVYIFKPLGGEAPYLKEIVRDEP